MHKSIREDKNDDADEQEARHDGVLSPRAVNKNNAFLDLRK
jgi:hypothetical protein